MTKVIVQHDVADYDRWYAVFAEREATRRRHGATGHSIYRVVTDPNTIVVVNDFPAADSVQAFLKDPSLSEAMERGGVEGAPQMWIVEEADSKRY